MAPLKILISGGGIAGHALAFWLSKLKHNITVIERFPGLRSTGLQVDLRGHGVEVLRRMGLEDKFRSMAVGEQGVEMVDKNGRVKAWFPANRSGKGLQSFTTDFEIMRGDLVKLLHEAAGGDVKYLFETSIKTVSELDNSIDVQFSNGESERFDLLIGADGQWSTTRARMLDPDDANPMHLLTQCMAYFTAAQQAQEGEKYKATTYIAPGSRGILTRRSNPDRIQIYLSCEAKHLEGVQRGNVDEEKAAFEKVFRGAGWKTDDIIQFIHQADDFYCERPGVVKLDSWSSRHIALVGDAAYCPTMNTGMGTTAAIVGAYVLAGEIGKHCKSPSPPDAIHTALREYQRKFRPFMDQIQRGIVEEDKKGDMIPSSPFGITVFLNLLSVAAFFKFDFFSRFILRENVKDWSLPDYPEMVASKD